MKRTLRLTSRLGIMIIAMSAMGCATQPKAPVHVDPLLAAIDKIVIVPAVDLRIDKKIKVNFEKQLQTAGLKVVKRKRYEVILSDNIGDVGQVTEEDLSTHSPEWIRKLGPEDSRYVMVLCLEDVAAKLTFGSTGNAVVSGHLYDKESGTLLWENKAVGQVGQGGLLGMALKGAMANGAIQAALANTLAQLQKKPRPGKTKNARVR